MKIGKIDNLFLQCSWLGNRKAGDKRKTDRQADRQAGSQAEKQAGSQRIKKDMPACLHARLVLCLSIKLKK
jgi:hypothetical protein